jgi:hypothetical protein
MGVDLLDLFRLELPLDLQLAQVAEQRALVRGQAIGLFLQCLQAIAGTARQRFGARAVGLGRQQPVVQVHRRTENGEAPRWQGATTENIGNI